MPREKKQSLVLEESFCPAKIMFAGEYSALEGGASLCASLKAYIYTKVEFTDTEFVEIDSSVFGHLSLSRHLGNESDPMVFHFCRFLLDKYGGGKGLKVSIRADFEPESGVGSSSAVLLSLGVSFLQKIYSHKKIVIRKASEDAWIFQRGYQSGLASGHDILVCAYRGFLKIQKGLKPWPGDIKRMGKGILLKHSMLFSGSRGSPTKILVKDVLQWLSLADVSKSRMDEWTGLMNECIRVMLEFHFHKQDAREKRKLIFKNLFKICEKIYAFQKGSPMENPILEKVREVKGYGKDFCFKTSGAGGLDTFIVIFLKKNRQNIIQRRILEVLKSEGWDRLEIDFETSI